jgi:beta-galactosidase
MGLHAIPWQLMRISLTDDTFQVIVLSLLFLATTHASPQSAENNLIPTSTGSSEVETTTSSSLAPRERLLFDFNWRFHLGDPPDAGKQFDYPERGDLQKTEKTYLDEEAKLARGRIDPVATNLGGKVSWVQESCDDGDWQKLNLPHDW